MAQTLQLVQHEKSASSSHTLVRLRASCNNKPHLVATSLLLLLLLSPCIASMHTCYFSMCIDRLLLHVLCSAVLCCALLHGMGQGPTCGTMLVNYSYSSRGTISRHAALAVITIVQCKSSSAIVCALLHADTVSGHFDDGTLTTESPHILQKHSILAAWTSPTMSVCIAV